MSSTRPGVQTFRPVDKKMLSEGRRRRILKRSLYGALLLLSILAIWSGYKLEHSSFYWWGHHFEWGEFYSHLLRDIGISGLVGFILANTFERLWADEFRRLTKEERDNIKRDVFYYVLGHDLPEEIRHEISTQILKKVCIRRNLIVDFELAIVPAPDTGERFMRTVCTMSYEIENLTRSSQPFFIKSSVDKSPILSLATETKFLSLKVTGSENDSISDEEWFKQQLGKAKDEKKQPIKQKRRRAKGEREIEIAESEIEIELTKEISILPKSRPMTKVEIAYQTVRSLRRGHLDFVFTSHTCDLDLTVRVCDQDVEVFAFANSPNDLIRTHRYHPPTYNWTIRQPLLAYQGFNITWVLKAATAAVSPSAGAETLHETKPNSPGS